MYIPLRMHAMPFAFVLTVDASSFKISIIQSGNLIRKVKKVSRLHFAQEIKKQHLRFLSYSANVPDLIRPFYNWITHNKGDELQYLTLWHCIFSKIYSKWIAANRQKQYWPISDFNLSTRIQNVSFLCYYTVITNTISKQMKMLATHDLLCERSTWANIKIV